MTFSFLVNTLVLAISSLVIVVCWSIPELRILVGGLGALVGISLASVLTTPHL